VFVFVCVQAFQNHATCVRNFATEAELEEYQELNTNTTWAALMLDGVDKEGES
jgi:hypothetical protein